MSLGFLGVWRERFGACEIERRPRGASRGKSDRRTAAPTFVSGQSILIY